MRDAAVWTVYLYSAGTTPFYVGRTSNLTQRHQKHRSESSWWNTTLTLEVLQVGDEQTTWKAERKWTKALRPQFNVAFNMQRFGVARGGLGCKPQRRAVA